MLEWMSESSEGLSAIVYLKLNLNAKEIIVDNSN